MEEGCPFCSIIEGVDSSVEVLARGPDWLAFFPDAPATPGHTLVIPKTHVRDWWQFEDPRELSSVAVATQLVGNAIQQVLQPDGMNLITSAGSAAEQTVFHLHVHVVPRWEADSIGPIWPPKHYTPPAIQEDLADQIRGALS